MTYYAIQSRDKIDYWNQPINGWGKVPYLYPLDKAVTIQAVRQHDDPCMKDAFVVEVTCDIKPVKAWVKRPLSLLMNLFPLTSINLIHSRLSDGTLRVCEDGWEVYE